MSIRKVNLSDLAGSLSQRGRERYKNDELKQALETMLEDGQPFIWETAKVTGKNDNEVSASKAKWRSRAVSVFESLNSEQGISVRWTDQNEMVIILK